MSLVCYSETMVGSVKLNEIRTRPWFDIKGMPNWQRIKSVMQRMGIEIFSQHYTTSGKLMTSDSHLKRLIVMVPENEINALSVKIELDRQGKVTAEFPLEHVQKVEDYLMERDGFFYALRSSLDSFFWEINLFFGLGISSRGMSYRRVRERMHEKGYCAKETTILLEKLKYEHWFKYLGDTRNELTHHTSSELVTFTDDYKIYLPSDPLKSQYKREERYEVPKCLKDLRDRTVEFLENGYNAIWNDSQTS